LHEMLGFVIIMVNLDYAKLNPYYSIPTIICGEPKMVIATLSITL
jgi:hypothetical protein